RFLPDPFAVFVQFADRVAQGTPTADGAAELQGESAECRLGFEITSSATQLLLENSSHCEVLHQGNDIRKRFMQRQDVGIRWLVEVRIDSIQYGVGGFVRHNVVGQACVNAVVGYMIFGIVWGRLEVAELQADIIRAIERVGLSQRMWL